MLHGADLVYLRRRRCQLPTRYVTAGHACGRHSEVAQALLAMSDGTGIYMSAERVVVIPRAADRPAWQPLIRARTKEVCDYLE